MHRPRPSRERHGLRALALACVSVLAGAPAPAAARPDSAGLRPFVFVLAADGDRVVCREAPDDAGLRARDTARLHEIRGPRAGKTGPGLTIVLRATDQLERFPHAKAAFERAAETWERTIAGTPMTIVVDVDYGETAFGQAFPSNVLGLTDPQLLLAGQDYEFVRSHLVAAASSDEEAALYGSLPARAVPTDAGSTRDLYVPTAVLRATHFLPPEAKPSAEHARLGNPPAIAISAAYPYDFDPSDGIDASTRDFEAVVLHELGHVLGFTSVVGARETSASFPVALSMLDLFRFRPGVDAASFDSAKRVLASGGEQVFFGGGEALPLSTGRQDASGGDGRQASHWKDEAVTGVFIGLMHPALKPGVHETLTANDLLAFDRLGYTLAPPPGPIASLEARLDGDVVTFTGTLASTPLAVASARVTMLDWDFRPVHDTPRFAVAIGEQADFTLEVAGFGDYPAALAARLTLFDASDVELGSALGDFSGGDAGGPQIRRATLARSGLKIAGAGFVDGAVIEVDGVPVGLDVPVRAKRSGTRLSARGAVAALGFRRGYNRVRVVVGGLRSNLVAVLFE
jgi:hypothetical protein